MSKVNINGVWKDLDKVFVNIGGIWKEVEKMFCNIGGAWKEVDLKKLLEYMGTVTPLGMARWGIAATNVGNYALFGGGGTSEASDIVDAYNLSLVRSQVLLAAGRMHMGAVTINNYALFGGGQGANSGQQYADVWSFDASLTRLTRTALSEARRGCVTARVGNYALFAAGTGKQYLNEVLNTVDAYNTSLVRTIATVLSAVRSYVESTDVGNYALFGGGILTDGSYTRSGVVDAYNTSLVRISPTALYVARYNAKGSKVGNYALFIGGIASAALNVIDVYDTALVRTTPIVSSDSNPVECTASLGGYAVAFKQNKVEAFDESLVRTILALYDNPRTLSVATTVGESILLSGGTIPYNKPQDTVNVYKLK